MAATLYERLNSVLNGGVSMNEASWPPLDELQPVSRTDRLLSLLSIYDLLTAPLEQVGSKARWANHPAVAGVKMRLENDWLTELEALCPPDPAADDPVAAIRSLAAKDRLPRVYRWVAETASLEQLRHFLAIEGGPDGGFDDLVALCQVGLDGAPKMELARNYWDEMGNGDPGAVHTELHRQMARAVELPSLPRTELPEAALQRAAFGGLLATNRWLQPEMIGALGLTELQAGPRCRLVLSAFKRLDVPAQAHAFYAVHADVDPRHGKDWLELAVAPLAARAPEWRARMVRGAAWRWHVNAELFNTLDIGQVVPAAA